MDSEKMGQLMAERSEEVERILQEYLPVVEGLQKTVLEAMTYSVVVGGKRLRPIMMLESYRIFGGSEKVIEPFAAAIEMIHTYSLVHDDLPAMDNDEYRRGKLTTHKKYGEAMGILAGDALLNYAYETALQAFDKAVEEKELRRIAEALKVLAGKAGIYGMVGGQVVDVEKDGDFVDEDMLMYVYVNKTSALLESCFMIGGILAGCSREQVEILEKSARNLGVAFQIQDDILDVVGDAKTLGKPVGSDARNEKTTYVSMYGLEEARKKVSEYTEESIVLLQNFDGEKTFLMELMTWMIQRDK